jgi:hypothetical protein
MAASENLQVFGEFNYIPLGSASFTVDAPGVPGSSRSSARLLNFGGGALFSFAPSEAKAMPYVAALVGNGRASFSASGTGSLGAGSVSGATNSLYAGAGIGLRYLLGSNWGIRPEFRYHRYLQNGGGNLLTFTGGVFFQFGK